MIWYSFAEENLDKLFDTSTNQETYMKLTMEFYKDSYLDNLIAFINDKKLELTGENKNLSFCQQQMVKQMLRGILLIKLKEYDKDLQNFKNFIKTINSRITNSKEILEEEYYFSYMISNKYPINLKIRIPIFEPIDVLYLFYKYDKDAQYKLGDIFKDVKCDFGGITDIVDYILSKKYTDMIEISDDIGQLFYQNICGKDVTKKDYLNIHEFLNKVSESENEDKKPVLELIASSLEFIKKFQENIFENQKKEIKYNLDDLNNLLDDNKKLMNCSCIFEKEIKENKNLYPPSFIFYINNNQEYVDNLFNKINLSKESVISDINKNINIDYLPFWLYILRNISSLNSIEFKPYKEIDKEIANNVTNNIKTKIIDFIKNKKFLNLKWLNLIQDKISLELQEPKISLFYHFFNSLIKNLNLTGKNVKSQAIKEIENYFYEIMNSVFGNNINQLFDQNIKKEDSNIILKFTENPSNFIYAKIKEYVNNKFIEIMNSEKICNSTEIFNNKLKELSDDFIVKIKNINKELFNNELQNLKEKCDKKKKTDFENIFEYCKLNDSMIDNLNSTKLASQQINNYKFNELNEYNSFLSRFINHGIKEKGTEEEKLVFYKLLYDFSMLNEKKEIYNC